MRFEFATATRIVFGNGALREAGSLAKDLGRRALVVTGKNTERVEPLLKVLDVAGVNTVLFPVIGEPEVKIVETGTALARTEHCDLVIAFGGGSAIDAGKAIAAMLTNDGELFDYLENIGRGKTLSQAAAPFIAIPTTAGTGAEVTRNAVLASPEHRLKVSLRSALMLPRIAPIDPELTYNLPPDLTASTGLDALTQLIEPYVCSRANPMTDTLCVEGLRRARSLRTAFMNGRDIAAREDMAIASLFGGLALANAGLGAVHGFAGPIGGMFSAPHGAICAALLPHVVAANIRALRERQPTSQSLRRYEEVGRLLTGVATARTEDACEWLGELVGDMKIPNLETYGIRPEHFPELVEKATQASSMKANPIALTTDELTAILRAAI